MISLTPIYERDGDRHYREFFEPEFVAQRLGRLGHWQGGAISKLGLSGSVQPKVFVSLLEGRTPQGDELLRRSKLQADRVLGWRLTLAAEGPVNALWALSSGALRGGIQVAHAHAVRRAVADFESTLNGRPWFNNPHAQGQRSILFAKFQCGASRSQTPRLETTLFLFNLLFQNGKENVRLRPSYVTSQQPRLHSIYATALGSGLARMVGGQVRVPPQLALRFEGNPPGRSGTSLRAGGNRPLRGRELFAAWQEQARNWGWRPGRTAELIRNARPTWSSWIQDYKTLGRHWLVWAFHPTHSPLRVREVLHTSREQPCARQSSSRDHDHGMSY